MSGAGRIVHRPGYAVRLPGGQGAEQQAEHRPTAAMVGYFDDLSAALAAGDADPADLGAIAERHSMEIIGPVPEGYL